MTDAEKYYHSLLTFGMRPGLERIKLLLDRLGNPEKSLRCIHVAGTNGKGTVCAFLSGILRSAGFKTGLYTSPYIVDFRERIQVNGEMIGENDLSEVTEKVKTEIDKLNSEDIIITEFEAVTAAAFLYYKNEKCDFVVLETGLGGRFDATNVIENPLVSVITSISLDHVKILGDTLSQIAFEKCGIIKNSCPTVTDSLQSNEASDVIKKQCSEKNSPLYIADYSLVKILSESVYGSEITYKNRKITVPFPGEHQLENCITALECADVLKKIGVDISEENIASGIKNAKNPARCEIVKKSPLVIFDGCHNEGSAKALDSVICKFLGGKRIKALMGMMSDKAIDKVLDILLHNFDSVVTVTPSNPRAMKASLLAEKIKEKGMSVNSFDSPSDGLEFALKNLKSDEALIVCGSLYLCADLRNSLV